MTDEPKKSAVWDLQVTGEATFRVSFEEEVTAAEAIQFFNDDSVDFDVIDERDPTFVAVGVVE